MNSLYIKFNGLLSNVNGPMQQGSIRIKCRDGQMHVTKNGSNYPWPKDIAIILPPEIEETVSRHFREICDVKKSEEPAPEAKESAYPNVAEDLGEMEGVREDSVPAESLEGMIKRIAGEMISNRYDALNQTLKDSADREAKEAIARRINKGEMTPYIKQVTLDYLSANESEIIQTKADKAVDASIRRNMEQGMLTEYIKRAVKEEFDKLAAGSLSIIMGGCAQREVKAELDRRAKEARDDGEGSKSEGEEVPLEANLKEAGKTIRELLDSYYDGRSSIALDEVCVISSQINAIIRSWLGKDVSVLSSYDAPKMHVQSYLSEDARHINVEIVGSWAKALGVRKYTFDRMMKEGVDEVKP